LNENVLSRSVNLRRLASAAAAVAVLAASEVYVNYNQTFDYSTFLIGVAIPLASVYVLFRRRSDRFILFAFLGYFWSVVDDAPVYFDSVFTWPEVTRFHPILPHYTLEVIFHLATLGFLYLSLCEVSGSGIRLGRRTLRIYLLLGLAFLLSYAQNVPLDAIQSIVRSSWYQLDIFEHLGSVAIFSLALIDAWSFGASLRMQPTTTIREPVVTLQRT
jgi:hypothetical protein